MFYKNNIQMSWGDIFTTVHIRTPPTWWLTYKLQLRSEKGKRPPIIVLGDILVGKCLSIFNLPSFIWSRCTWMPLFTLTVGLYQRPLVARQYGPHELSPLNVIGALTPLVINLIFSTHSTHNCDPLSIRTSKMILSHCKDKDTAVYRDRYG